jgi:hypothetical protein
MPIYPRVIFPIEFTKEKFNMNSPSSMPSSIYCRGCGKTIHPDAASCPHCGAPQVREPVKRRGNIAPAIVSCVSGSVALLGALGAEDWGSEEVLGLLGFVSIAVVCGLIELTHQNASRATAVVGLTTAGIALLVGLSYL